ncbi:hypothetical protein Leryth_022905 [Lithospermum erythrorhizon]|nr:hypothetical protein Leryth_022905 [Lithospermum erythrorhizon]
MKLSLIEKNKKQFYEDEARRLIYIIQESGQSFWDVRNSIANGIPIPTDSRRPNKRAVSITTHSTPSSPPSSQTHETANSPPPPPPPNPPPSLNSSTSTLSTRSPPPSPPSTSSNSPPPPPPNPWPTSPPPYSSTPPPMSSSYSPISSVRISIPPLLVNSKVFLRKKAILCLIRVFDKYPDSVRVCFKRLVENLESRDEGVVSAVVGVFCEMAKVDPRAYLPLAPEFFRVLVESRNNWILIKVLKIFARLVPLEGRLGKKVVEPICEHLRRTGAKSLVFECVRTIFGCLSEYDVAVNVAMEKVREFLMDDDPNLRYLGLQALSTVAPKHLWAIQENKEFVIRALSDADVNIRFEALTLLMAMVCEDNVVEICRVLVTYALKSDPEFCNEILGSILSVCSKNYYEVVVDFDWYISLLGDMSRIVHCQKGEEIEDQLIDIGMRVRDVRSTLVRVSRQLLIDPALLGNPFVHRILCAAAWVSGEYVEFSKNPIELIEALMQPRASLLPPLIRAVYIQSAFKVLAFCLHCFLFRKDVTFSFLLGSLSEEITTGSSDRLRNAPSGDSDGDGSYYPRSSLEETEYDIAGNGEAAGSSHVHTPLASSKTTKSTGDSIRHILNIVETTLGPLSGSNDVEILERVRNILGLVMMIKQEFLGTSSQEGDDNQGNNNNASKIINLMHEAFSEELGPVSISAQEKVPIPDGVVLKQDLGDLDSIYGDIKLPLASSFSLVKRHSLENDSILTLENYRKDESETECKPTALSEHRKRHGLYYLPLERKETSDDYPPANDPTVQDNINADTENLAKLTEQSLVFKKKANTKPRPVVVKLDDGDSRSILPKKQEPKDDLVSDAVRDVLRGNEAEPSSSSTAKEPDRASSKRGKEKALVDGSGDPLRIESSRSRDKSSRSKHHRQNKEKKHGSPETGKAKSSSRHGTRRSKNRAEGSANIAVQSPVIPDFLL